MARALIGLALLVAQAGADTEPPSTDDQVPTEQVADEPVPVAQQPELPLGGTLADRLWCIEWLESRHDPYAVNPSSGAAGLLQWLPSTARAWGVVVGNRRSEWFAAERIHAVSETFFVSQWPVTGRLCP